MSGSTEVTYDVIGWEDGVDSLLLEGLVSTIDWLTVTTRTAVLQGLLAQEALRWMDHYKALGFVQRPWRWRGYCGWTCAGVRYGTRDDGTLLQLSGASAALNWPVALAWCENVTRIDLAVTITLSEPMPGLAKRAFDFITLDGTTTCKYSRRFSLVVNNVGGETLYVGSRASDQMGRLYDKGREMSDDETIPTGKIWRYEVEFKQYRAKRIANQLFIDAAHWDSDGQAEKIGATVYKWFLTRGIKPIWNTDGAAYLMEVQAKVSDDERSLDWLSTQVSPTVVRLCRNGKKAQVVEALGLSVLDILPRVQ